MEKVILTHFTHSSKASSIGGSRYHLFRVRSAQQKCFSVKDGGQGVFNYGHSPSDSLTVPYVVVGGFADPNGFQEVFWGKKM